MYFAGPRITGCQAIKIGWSNNPWATVREGSHRWTWFGLVVLAVIDCSGTEFAGTRWGGLEQRLHRFFAGANIKGEWFEPRDALVELVNLCRKSRLGPLDAMAWMRTQEAA